MHQEEVAFAEEALSGRCLGGSRALESMQHLQASIMPLGCGVSRQLEVLESCGGEGRSGFRIHSGFLCRR